MPNSDDILNEVDLTPYSRETIRTHLAYIRRDLKEMKDEMEKKMADMVTKSEFIPVRNVVYAMLGIILVAVIGAIVAGVLK